MTGRVPVVVLGGWLGAGKTTVVNHLLRQAQGRRIAVLVNDFGDVPIDADLIEGRLASDVLALAGGCICCSVGSDLVGTLAGLLSGDAPPDVVLVECSGVALPASVARTARLVPQAEVDGIVVLVDAEQFPAWVADPYVGDTARSQAVQADLVVVTKTDLADPGAARRSLRSITASAPVVDAARGDVPIDVVLGIRALPQAADARPFGGPGRFGPDAAAAGPSGLSGSASPGDAARRYASETRRPAGPLDIDRLTAELADPATGLLRAKGCVTGLDGRRWWVQATGRRVSAEPVKGPAPEADALVLIRAVVTP